MPAIIQSAQGLAASATSVSVTLSGVLAGSTLLALVSRQGGQSGVSLLPTNTGPSALTWTLDVDSGWLGLTGLSRSTATVAGDYVVSYNAGTTAIPLQLVVIEARLQTTQLDVAGPRLVYSGATASTTATSPAITTTVANDLIVAAVLADGTTTLTGTTGYTALHKNEVSTAGTVGAIQIKEVAATGSQTAPFTLGTAQTWGHMIAAYRVQPGPVGTAALGLVRFRVDSYGPNVPQVGYIQANPAPFALAASSAFRGVYTGSAAPALAAFVAAVSGAVVSRNATAVASLAPGAFTSASVAKFVSIRATGTADLSLLAFGRSGAATFTSKSIGTLAYPLPAFALATVAAHPVVPDATMPITYVVEVGWSGLTTGTFILDRSLINGPDLISGGVGGQTYTDISAQNEVEEVRIERGRQDATGPIQAGVCTIVVKDTTGKYNPLNTASPFYGQIIPMRRIRVSARWNGVNYPLFAGYLRRLTDNPDYGQQKATMIAEDMLLWLSRMSPTIAATGTTTTGNAIAAILDATGFTDLSLRRLDAGDSIPDFSADGTKTALSLIGDLLAAERGVFYVTPAGVARFESRGYRTTFDRSTPQGTIFGSMEYLNIGVDLDQIKNRATVTRTPPAPAAAGVAQVASDTDSQKQYGVGDWGSVSSPYIATDAQALNLANYLVAQQKLPQPPIGRLEINAAEANAYYTFITRDILDRLLVYAPFGVSGDFHIQRIEHTIVGGEPARGVWILTQRGDAAALANY